MWILGVVVIAVMVACVYAIFFLGKNGPFAAMSHFAEDGKVYNPNGATDFQDGTRKPRNENELL
ncbi:MAG TPA: hypothetical protein VF257_14915 [Solirubrobacteraceae bacterium]